MYQDMEKGLVSKPTSPDNQNQTWCSRIGRLVLIKTFEIVKFVALLLLLIFSLPVAILIWSPIVAAVVAVSIPLLLLTLSAIRLVQLMTNNNGEDNGVQSVKLWARTWLSISITALLAVMGLFKVFVVTIPTLKHGTIVGVLVSEWVDIVCIICGLSHLSFLILISPYITHQQTGYLYVIPEPILKIVDCLVFWWAEHEVMKRVPAFKAHNKLLGLHTQKWIEHSLFVLIGVNIITFFTQSIVWSMRKWIVSKRRHIGDSPVPGKSLVWDKVSPRIPTKYLLYYANGVRSNVSFLLACLLLLLTWVLYFGTQLSGTSQAQRAVRFGTWTFLSLFIFSFLCLIKAFVLLSWEANAIYIRLSSKILQAGKQLYFLGIITRHDCDILRLLYREDKAKAPHDDISLLDLVNRLFQYLETSVKEVHARSLCDQVDEWGTDDSSDENIRRKLAQQKRDKLRHDLLLPEDYTPTVYDILQVAQTFFATRDALSKDMHIPLILDKLQTAHNPDNVNDSDFKNNLRRLIDGQNNAVMQTQGSHQHPDVNNSSVAVAHDSLRDSDVNNNTDEKAPNSKPDSDVKNNADDKRHDSPIKKKLTDFEELLQHAIIPKLSGQELQSWMERSHVNCLIIGNILSNAKEAVEYLNKIINWVLIGGTFLMWLFLTGLAYTEVLVLIASPLLAGTFIFGDTCKSFFQGIMFVYVVHPFDVGDLCSIDEKLMEVKSIGVWKTIFSNVNKAGGQEEVIFPNSELANKIVINHKSEFDCNDYVEFNLDIKDSKKISKLISDIQERLNSGDAMFTTISHSVALLKGEDDMNIKIAVRFGHKLKLNATHIECLKNKDKLRTNFILYVKSLVNKASFEQASKETRDPSDLSTKTS